MSTKKIINNLFLINSEYLIYKDDSENFYSFHGLTLKKELILPFEVDISGSKLIVFLLKSNTDISVLIIQWIDKEFHILYPKNFIWTNNLMIQKFKLLNLPDLILSSIPQNEYHAIQKLLISYIDKELDDIFIKFFTDSVFHCRYISENSQLMKKVLSINDMSRSPVDELSSDSDIIHPSSPSHSLDRGSTKSDTEDSLICYSIAKSVETTLEDISEDSDSSDYDSDSSKDSDSSEDSDKTVTYSAEETNSFDSSDSSKETKLDYDLKNSKLIEIPKTFIVTNIEQYTGKKEKVLGRGEYSKVYSTLTNTALKIFKKPHTDEIMISSLKEIIILRYLIHPNIINVLCVQCDPEIIAMPLASGTLDDYQLEYIKYRKMVFYQIFHALQYCHNNGVWHCDIKPMNILVFESDIIHIKLTDFGLSSFYSRKEDNNVNIVSLYWRAPELLLRYDKYNETIDVWSVGVMLLEQILNKNLLEGDSILRQLDKIHTLLGLPTKEDCPIMNELMKDSYKILDVYERTLEKQYDFNKDELEILQHCLQWPTKRYTSNQILKLKYWEDVSDKIKTKLNYSSYKDCEINKDTSFDKIRWNCLVKNQKILVKQFWFSSSNRRIIYEYIYKVGQMLEIQNRSIFYTFLMYDILVERRNIPLSEYDIYGVCLLKISAELFDVNVPYTDEYIKISNGKINLDILTECTNKILNIMNYNFIYSTCDDFIYNYLHDTKYEKEYDKILYYSFVLILNYDYVIRFSPKLIAQIAILACNITIDGIQNNLYSDEIKNYFKKFVPEADFASQHRKYFLDVK